MKGRTSALVIAALLALAGCGAPDDQFGPLEESWQPGPQGGRPVLLAAGEAPRVEGTVRVDPVIETPSDPIWRENWLPIDNAERTRTRTVQMMDRFVAPRPGMVIANVGAGGGFYDFRWSPLVGPTGQLFAVDIDRRMTRKIAFETAARRVSNVRPVWVPRGSLGLAPNSVDVVTFIDTGAFGTCFREHNPGYFRQAAEALRPGGRLVIFNDYDVSGERGSQSCRNLTPDEVIELAAPYFTVADREDVLKGPWRAFGILFQRRS